MRAWAQALTHDGAVSSDREYQWLVYRLRLKQGMLIRDAATIAAAGMRGLDPHLPSPTDWHVAISNELPVILKFHHGYGVPNRFKGIYDTPFEPVMMTRAQATTLVEQLAFVAVERDDGDGRRAKKARQFQEFFDAKYAGSRGQVGWNASASYAIEHVAALVVFRDFYRGRFGPYSRELEDGINEVGHSIGMEIDRILADREPGAFERGMERLQGEVQISRERANAKASAGGRG